MWLPVAYLPRGKKLKVKNNNGIVGVFICGFLFLSLIGSCTDSGTSVTTSSIPTSNQPVRNDYQDMRNRGHSEEDAVIFSILKQQGYSDYDSINATKSSKER